MKNKVYTVAWKRNDDRFVKLQVHPHENDTKLKFTLEEAIEKAKQIHIERNCETRVYKGWELVETFK